MAGKLKHISRSRKTAARRLMAAKYYLNYSLTQQERKAMRQLMIAQRYARMK